MENKKVYEKTCKRCGETFKTEQKCAYFCDGCKSVKRPAKRVSTGEFDLMQMTRLLKRYNNIHGTDLTYGQFVNEIKMGRILKAELRVI